MIVLEIGDKIQGISTVDAVVDFSLSGLDNKALSLLATGQVTSSLADLYTADSVDVVKTMIFVNTHSDAIYLNLYILPSGGTARRILAKDLKLSSGTAIHTDGERITLVHPVEDSFLASVDDDPYNATTWNANTDAATKNAIRDKIETLESGHEELTFAYGDATPQLIFTAGAGDIISSVELSIITPFNGTGSALSIGDVGVTDRLMSTAENMPDTEGTYITTPLHEYSASTAVSVYITPGAGASAGNGFIKIYTK